MTYDSDSSSKETTDSSDSSDNTSSESSKLYLEGQILNHYNIIYQIGKVDILLCGWYIILMITNIMH